MRKLCFENKWETNEWRKAHIDLVVALLLVVLEVVALERDGAGNRLRAVRKDGERLIHPARLKAETVRQLVRGQRQRVADGAAEHPRAEQPDRPRGVLERDGGRELRKDHDDHARQEAGWASWKAMQKQREIRRGSVRGSQCKERDACSVKSGRGTVHGFRGRTECRVQTGF